MTTFNKIINKVVNLDNNIFSLNYDKTDKVSGINKIFFKTLSDINLFKNYKNKFDFLDDTLNNFYFLNKPIEKNEFFNLFNKIQSVYHTLNRFVYLYKYKKSKLTVDMDLQLNKIQINDINVLCIYHVNSKYLFKIEDILKIIYISLTNCYSFIADPISIKNPYNNIPFNKSILYYIYYFLISYAKFNNIKPEYIDIFFKFKESNFNMTKFVNSYEYILREYAIKNYLNNSTKETLVQEIKILIKLFNSKMYYNNKIIISEEFPKDILIRIMKPYIYLNLQSNYSLVEKNKIDARKKLIKKLLEFQRFNPNFGRRLIKFKDIVCKNGKIKRIKSHIEFNMKHKKFNTYEIDNFMNNHLLYKYDNEETNPEFEYTFTIFSHLMIHAQPNLQNESLLRYQGNEQEDEEEQEEDEEEQEQEEDEEDEEEEDEEEEDEEEEVDSIS